MDNETAMQYSKEFDERFTGSIQCRLFRVIKRSRLRRLRRNIRIIANTFLRFKAAIKTLTTKRNGHSTRFNIQDPFKFHLTTKYISRFLALISVRYVSVSVDVNHSRSRYLRIRKDRLKVRIRKCESTFMSKSK